MKFFAQKFLFVVTLLLLPTAAAHDALAQGGTSKSTTQATQVSREASVALETYAQNQPQDLAEWFGMETLIAEAFQKTKDYAAMSRHAQEMFKVAKLVTSRKTANPL